MSTVAAPIDSTPASTGAYAGGAVVELQNVAVRFGPLRAVRGVSLALGSGHLLGLIGPNGAGKTTLLRTLCGLQQPTSGSVKILGERLSPDRPDLQSQIGFTPDTPGLYDDLTVRQFLRFIGKGYRLDRRLVDERIELWLEKVWLSEKAETKIKSLSRGMKQRVGIARTLLPNPAVVVLDEPAAGLDPAGRVQFRQLLCELRDQGKALVVSSHILSDMSEYCTHIGIMSAGRLVRFGTVDEVTTMHGSDRCRYTVKLAKPVPQVLAQLEQVAELTHATVDRLNISFEYSSDAELAAELLALLIGRGLPIASFVANKADLEEAYMRAGVAQVD